MKGRRPKIFYATQVGVAPPTFVFFAREAGSVHFSYRRYLENRLRETFGFLGTPIRLVFRERATIREPRGRAAGGRKGAGKAAAATKAAARGSDARPIGKGRPSGAKTARATRRG